MTTLDERMTADGVKVTNGQRTEQPRDRFDADWWKITIHNKYNRSLTIPFGMGRGHDGRMPTAHEILECLLSDASGIENASTFEEWADEYGEDPDSRKAFRTWEAASNQTKRLRTFLGDDYDAYLWETDND